MVISLTCKCSIYDSLLFNWNGFISLTCKCSIFYSLLFNWIAFISLTCKCSIFLCTCQVLFCKWPRHGTSPYFATLTHWVQIQPAKNTSHNMLYNSSSNSASQNHLKETSGADSNGKICWYGFCCIIFLYWPKSFNKYSALAKNCIYLN